MLLTLPQFLLEVRIFAALVVKVDAVTEEQCSRHTGRYSDRRFANLHVGDDGVGTSGIKTNQTETIFASQPNRTPVLTFPCFSTRVTTLRVFCFFCLFLRFCLVTNCQTGWQGCQMG